MRLGIVNDSPVAAEILRRLVCASNDHQVVWIARDGAEAVSFCERDLPQLVLMDLILPYMDGAEATRRIMSRTPCPILIVTANVGGNSAKVFEALGAGALDAVDTPGATSTPKGGQALLLKIEGIGRQVYDRRTLTAEIAPQVETSAKKLVLIGASAGGPSALAEVLSALPEDFSPAVVIVQHIDRSFAAGLAEWLKGHSKLGVRLVREGDALSPASVLLASTQDHLVFKSSRTLGYAAEPIENPYRPSVDVFFESALRFYRGTMAGVLLTGMGRDGARGLKSLREAGYPTIAQDQGTSAVYGMPKAAAEINAASEILPLAQIGPRLRELFRSDEQWAISKRKERRTMIAKGQ